MQSSRDNTFHGSNKVVEKSRTLLLTNKAAESTDSDLACLVLSLEDGEAHFMTSDPSGIITIEKKYGNNHLGQRESR